MTIILFLIKVDKTYVDCTMLKHRGLTALIVDATANHGAKKEIKLANVRVIEKK